jgi:hypothetical protein
MEREMGQIVAFYVGMRREAEAKALWEKIPDTYKLAGQFYTDGWEASLYLTKFLAITIVDNILSNRLQKSSSAVAQRSFHLATSLLSVSLTTSKPSLKTLLVR